MSLLNNNNNYVEEWRPIPNWEELYHISNHGRIKSLEKKVKAGMGYRVIKEKILKPKVDKDGYLLINLSIDSRPITYKVHRLVAESFIPNPENKPQVNHKKGVKSDNRALELEWSTQSENQKHAYRELNKKSSKGMAGKYGLDPRSKPVLCLTTGIYYVSAKDAARQTGVNKRSILDTCNGKQSFAKGMEFKFI